MIIGFTLLLIAALLFLGMKTVCAAADGTTFAGRGTLKKITKWQKKPLDPWAVSPIKQLLAVAARLVYADETAGANLGRDLEKAGLPITPKVYTARKYLTIFAGTAMLVSVFCMTGAAAADTIDTASERIGSGSLTVKCNGEAVVFPDAQPFVDENSRTLIPVRFVAETMGAAVSWNQETQTAVIEQNGITVSVPIGSDTITVTENGATRTVTMDTAAIIREERT